MSMNDDSKSNGHVFRGLILGLAGLFITAVVVKVFVVYYDMKEKELFGNVRAPQRSFESLEEARCLND